MLAVRPPADVALRPGDILLAVDDRGLTAPSDLVAHLRRTADPRVTLRLRRADAVHTITVPLTPLPQETCPGAHVLHDMVEVPGARLRTILTIPNHLTNQPAWLLLPGIGCTSVDFAISPRHPLRPVVAALTAAGAITLRIERPGLGDSEGPPCDQLGFWQEVAAYSAGLAALAADPRIAPDSLAVFGHSLGGMIAPLLAAERPLARIAVIGTTAAAWDRSLERAVDRAAARTGLPAAAVRLAARSDRCPRFHHELAAVDLPAAWSRTTADVLVARGLADDVIDPEDHDALVALLARRPRGAVRRLDLPGVGHDDLADPALLAMLVADRSAQPGSQA